MNAVIPPDPWLEPARICFRNHYEPGRVWRCIDDKLQCSIVVIAERLGIDPRYTFPSIDTWIAAAHAEGLETRTCSKTGELYVKARKRARPLGPPSVA